MRERYGEKQSARYRDEYEQNVEDDVPDIETEKGALERYRFHVRRRDKEFSRTVLPFYVLAAQESERANAQSVKERAYVETEGDLGEVYELEDVLRRHSRHEREKADYEREREEHGPRTVRGVHPELFFQHHLDER